MTEVSPIAHGLDPILRPELPGSDSAILTVILAVAVVNAFMFPVMLRLWREFFKNLGRGRRQEPVNEHTVGERWVMVSALVLTVLAEALALFCARSDNPPSEAFAALMGTLVLVLIFHVVQTCGYLLMGYAFAPKGGTRNWLRSFVLSQSLMGYLMIVPALGALFYPTAASGFLIACGVIFVACRILFYINGFIIFYTSPASIFYFFLYLCTLEIVPLPAVWSVAGYFTQLFC